MTTITTIPETAEELEEMLSDNKRMAPLFAQLQKGNAGPFQEFVKAYKNKVMINDPTLIQQVTEKTQATLADAFRVDARSVKVDMSSNGQLQVGGSLSPSRSKGAAYNKAALGAILENRVTGDDRFTSTGEYLQAVKEHHSASGSVNRDALMAKLALVKKFMASQEVRNSFGGEDPGAGGFLFPESYRSQIMTQAVEQAVVRPRAQVYAIGAGSRLVLPGTDDTSHASSLFGGITLARSEEGIAIAESQAKFRRIVLDATKLAGLFKIPNETLTDAVGLTSWLDNNLPGALAWFEDVDFMLGDGVGGPLGFINCPAAYSSAAEAGQPSATIVVENLADMYAHMLPSSMGSAVWIVSQGATVKQLLTMALSVGTGGSPVFLVNGGIQDAPNLSIYGRPVIISEKCSALGLVGDVNFVDLNYYAIGDRQTLAVSTSNDRYWDQDMIGFKITVRNDGRPTVAQTLTLKNGQLVSPYVQLAARP